MVVWSDFVFRKPALMSTAPLMFRLISGLPKMLKIGLGGMGIWICVIVERSSPRSSRFRLAGGFRASSAIIRRNSSRRRCATYSVSGTLVGILTSVPPTVSRKTMSNVAVSIANSRLSMDERGEANRG